jgi:hypothetical protein
MTTSTSQAFHGQEGEATVKIFKTLFGAKFGLRRGV